MPAQTFARTKNISGAYIFLGSELGKKQQAIDEIRRNLAGMGEVGPAGGSDFEETVFYAEETPAGQIASKIQNHSLFAAARLFLIKKAELINKKEDIELIVSCIKNTEDGSTLILISDENKISAGLEAAVPSENKRIFYELFEREKNQWVRDFFRQQGFTIDAAGVETVLELVENNTEAMSRECSRLMLFLHSRQKNESASMQVSATEIEEWLSHNREESAFTLFSRIAKGDLAKALESFRSILEAKESAVTVLSGLIWCFRKLRDYHALPQSKRSDYAELRKIGLGAPKSRDEYAAAAQLFDSAAVDACLALSAEYDILFRSFGAPFEKILADVYVFKILGLGHT